MSVESQEIPSHPYTRLHCSGPYVVCHLCGALVLGELGWDESYWRRHLKWHDALGK